MKHISTIDELVEFLGGDTSVATTFGISQSAVAQWKIRNQIAAGWHLRLLADVRRRGATIDPAVFGLSPEEAAGLFGTKRSRLKEPDPPAGGGRKSFRRTTAHA